VRAGGAHVSNDRATNVNGLRRRAAVAEPKESQSRSRRGRLHGKSRRMLRIPRSRGTAEREQSEVRPTVDANDARASAGDRHSTVEDMRDRNDPVTPDGESSRDLGARCNDLH
jgi:hypothetical protein